MAGWRCEVCVGCGRCLETWGLTGADAASGATNWADAFKALDDGSAGAPPPCPAAPGATAPDAPRHAARPA
ncbi:MAG: hypothetical protein HFJ75_02875, partial [Eggerthellaceae bacterium]|nr:hypothetical protein [Eggerthellaceae bacterium]